MPSTRPYRSQSLVFRKGKAKNEVEHFAAAMDWPLRGEVAADPDRGTPYELQWSAGPALVMHYTEDDLSNTGYLVITGQRDDATQATAKVAERHLKFSSFDELLQEAGRASGTAERCRALIRVAIGAPRVFDRRLFDIIQNSLHDENPDIREAALWATSYPAWPQFRKLLENVAVHDPDHRIRDTAQGIAEAFCLATSGGL